VDAPETRYARSGEFSIAYETVGEGVPDLVWIPSFTHHLELNWENPWMAAFLQAASSRSPGNRKSAKLILIRSASATACT